MRRALALVGALTKDQHAEQLRSNHLRLRPDTDAMSPALKNITMTELIGFDLTPIRVPQHFRQNVLRRLTRNTVSPVLRPVRTMIGAYLLVGLMKKRTRLWIQVWLKALVIDEASGRHTSENRSKVRTSHPHFDLAVRLDNASSLVGSWIHRTP